MRMLKKDVKPKHIDQHFNVLIIQLSLGFLCPTTWVPWKCCCCCFFIWFSLLMHL